MEFVEKYKLLCIDVEWFREDGKGIKLQKEDSNWCSMWPRRVLLLVAPKAMRDVEDIKKDIFGCVKY